MKNIPKIRKIRYEASLAAIKHTELKNRLVPEVINPDCRNFGISSQLKMIDPIFICPATINNLLQCKTLPPSTKIF